MRRGPARTRALATIFLVLLAGGCLSAASREPTGAPRGGGDRVRDFAFEDINPASPTHGMTLTLSELYPDRGLVLQFVASWCKPCRDELPNLQRLHAERRAPILLVAADEHGERDGVLTVVAQNGITAPLLFVPEDRAEQLSEHYDYEIIPATYLIGSDGTVRESHEGAWSSDRLSAAIARQLGL